MLRGVIKGGRHVMKRIVVIVVLMVVSGLMGCSGSSALEARAPGGDAASPADVAPGVDAATLPDVAGSADGLVQQADAAMYQVKARGKNGIQAAVGSTVK